MMLVRVRADRSPLHGLGLFADEPIPAGAPVWRWESGFDHCFDREAFAGLPPPARRHLEHYGFYDAPRQTWRLNGDLSIFMNHSANPNTGAPGADGVAEVTFALRPIAPGEEITCDYRAFDSSAKPVP